jgi:hypothetical protein
MSEGQQYEEDVVKWRAWLDEDVMSEGSDPSIDWQETLLGGWIDSEDSGSDAVNRCIEDYLVNSGHGWNGYFGDSADGFFAIEVSSPQSIAGTYYVDLKKVIRARSQKVKANE